MSTTEERAGDGAGRWIRAPRRGIAYGLVALACLLTLVVSMSVWVNRQLLDTDTWVDQSNAMLANDEVRHALAVRLVDAAYARGDVAERLEERLPPDLRGLATPIGHRSRAFTDRGIMLGRVAIGTSSRQMQAAVHRVQAQLHPPRNAAREAMQRAITANGTPG